MTSLASHPRPYETPEAEHVETDTAIETDYEFKHYTATFYDIPK